MKSDYRYSTENSMDQEYRELLKTNKEIIDKFCEIGARKVSVIDEYGKENWSILNSEKQKCFTKIAEKLGISEKFLDKLYLELEMDEVAGLGIDRAISKMGQNLRFALANAEPDNVYLSFYLVRLYFFDLEKIFREAYDKSKEYPKGNAEYNTLSGVEFEVTIGKELTKNGYVISGTPTTGDQGADIIANKNEKRYVIQVKRYSGLVGNKAVQEVVAAKSYYQGDVAVVVTNSKFTPAAKDLAQKNKVLLIDGDSIGALNKILEDSVI